jgi:octaprenyl-diphosphate synthase
MVAPEQIHGASADVPTLDVVQAPVRAELDEVMQAMASAATRDVPVLAFAAQHLLGMKGKLFRPTLVLLSSAVEGAPPAGAVRSAAAVELMHLATLVHDDAVDHSLLRRGMPTINALFNDQTSVIMGDFLYSIALALLVEQGSMAPLQALVDASTAMTIGELRQLSTPHPLAFSEDDYNLLIRAKTASLISAACRVGALCGAPAHVETLAAYGDALGMVFQITDDLIDYTEESETTGKPSGLDLREHKVTLPLIAALRTMSRADRAQVEALFAAEVPSDEDVAAVTSIVIESGGLEYARQRAEEHAARAHELLATLPPSPARDALGAAISYVMERHA